MLHKDRVWIRSQITSHRCKMHQCSQCRQTGSNMILRYMWIKKTEQTVMCIASFGAVLRVNRNTEGRKKENLLSFLRDTSCVMLWYLHKLICPVSNVIIYYQAYMPSRPTSVTSNTKKELWGLCLSCEDNYYLSAISYQDDKHFFK